MTKKLLLVTSDHYRLPTVFKNVTGWKTRSVSFPVIPVFKREDLWEEAEADHSDNGNFIGSLPASLQLFTVRSQLKTRGNWFEIPNVLINSTQFPCIHAFSHS